MTLNEWLAKNHKTATDFADDIGVAPSTITRVLNGLMYPGYPVLLEIHKATKGKVTLGDFKLKSA